MAPPLRRTVTLLEAHPTHTTSSDDFRASTTARPPPTHTHTEKSSSPSPPHIQKTRRSTRRGPSSTTPTSTTPTDGSSAATPSSQTKKTRRSTRHGSTTTPYTSSFTVTEYSSTTTLYTHTYATSTSASSSSVTTTFSTPVPSQTISGPPIHRTRYQIPDPPVWFPFLLAIFLGIMFALAAVFYCVNFPPTGRPIVARWRRWREGLARKRYGYRYQRLCDQEAADGLGFRDEPALELSDLPGNKVAGYTTSATTPAPHNTPTLYSRRRNVEPLNMSVDTAAATGLGITLPGTGNEIRRQKSFDETLLRPYLDKPLPKPPRTPVLPFLSSSQGERKSSADLEAGLFRPSACVDRRQQHVQGESAPPSPGMNKVLEMVGGSVEYAAEKMSRFMCDQVKGDPEEWLLLPVRDCEREGRVGVC